jgi:truncated hemoglobin YjbI
MPNSSYPAYTPSHGYMTENIQQKYIAASIKDKTLPDNANRMPDIVTLNASEDQSKPIQFWQLYSVLGQKRIVRIVQNFYQRVYRDEPWFSSIFAKIGDTSHHVRTQSAMWLDVMGGGFKYHGAEFRLNFHHQHNAIELMNKKGAERWIRLMIQTLDDTAEYMTDDPRVRISINTFLAYFITKYAAEFGFQTNMMFGTTNSKIMQKINLRNMTDAAIEALSELELRAALTGRGFSLDENTPRQELAQKAQRL